MFDVKKALLERLIYLNSKTNAFENEPHKITSEELKKSFNKARRRYHILLGTSIVFSIAFSAILFPKESTNVPRYAFVLFFAALFSTIVNTFRKYLKLQKIKEQIFFTKCDR